MNFTRKQALTLAAAALGSWAILIAAVAGGYQVGGYVVSWLEDSPSFHIAGGAASSDLDLKAEELSKISPAAGSD